jgi:hypothetical protein
VISDESIGVPYATNQLLRLPQVFRLITLNPLFCEPSKIFPLVALGQLARLVRRVGRESAGHDQIMRPK